MFKLQKEEYESLVKDIKNNEQFLKLNEDIHHGTSKYEHCNRVGYKAYKIAKSYNLNYEKTARAGILHDFFYGQRTDKIENSYTNHPFTSARNAKEVFGISLDEENIIKTHMFPEVVLNNINPFAKSYEKKKIRESIPQSKEAWIVCIADFIVSIEELGRFKISFTLSCLMLFILNILTINK